MNGLPYIADNIKVLLKWGLISVVTLFCIWLVWIVFSGLFRLIFPPEPEPADTAFGKLKQPFSYNSKFASNIFTLDTAGNAIVDPPRLITVYEVPIIEGEFASLDNAKKIARSAGLDSDPQQISENEWRWTNKKNPNRSLKFNITTHNFIYSYDWNADNTALENVFKKTTDEAMISKAKGYLSTYKSLTKDLKNGKTKVTFWKISGNDRKKVGSFSEANAVRVEFYRQEIDENNQLLEFNPDLSQINVLISGATTSDKQLLEINYVYYAYNKDKKATYEPKSGKQAYEDLKQARAYIATGFDKNFDTITITETSLAYVNPSTETTTLQPVYVFKGFGETKGEKSDFLAYVPAISSAKQR